MFEYHPHIRLRTRPLLVINGQGDQVVPLAYVSATTVGVGFLWTGPFVKREQEEGTRIRIMIKLKEIEIEKGMVDDEQLALAKERLNDLEALFGY